MLPREYKLEIKTAAESQVADFKPEPNSFVLLKTAGGWEFYYLTQINEKISIDPKKVISPSGQTLAKALANQEIAALDKNTLIEIIQASRESWIIRPLDNILVAARAQLLRYKDREDLPNCSQFKTIEKQGRRHLSEQMAVYEKNVSQAVDYFLFQLLDIIAAKAMNGELGLMSINPYLESCGANHAARYMSTGHLPHIISDLLFQKMLWVEWTLKAVKALRTQGILNYGTIANLALDRALLNPRIDFAKDELDAYVKKPGNEYLQPVLSAFRASYHNFAGDVDTCFEQARHASEAVDKLIQAKQAQPAEMPVASSALANSSSSSSRLVRSELPASLDIAGVDGEIEKLRAQLNQETEALLSTTAELRNAQLKDVQPDMVNRVYDFFHRLVVSGKEEKADYAKSKVAQLQAAVAQALQRVDVIEKKIEHLRLQKEKLEFESQLTRAKEWYAELLTRYSSKSEEMLRLNSSFQFTESQILPEAEDEKSVSAINSSGAAPVDPLLIEIDKFKQQVIQINREAGRIATKLAELEFHLPQVSQDVSEHCNRFLQNLNNELIAWETRLAENPWTSKLYPTDPNKARYCKALLNSGDIKRIIQPKQII